MKKLLFSSLLLLVFAFSASAQDFLGQWYAQDSVENQYLIFQEDTVISVYEMEGDDCYEFDYYAYEDSLDFILISMEGMTWPMMYMMEGDSLYLTNPDGDQFALGANDDDVSEFVDCADSYTWACGEEGCFETEAGLGEFASLEDCEWECFVGEVTYDCYNGSCYEAGEWGEYGSLEECEEICSEGSDSTMYECWGGSCYESMWGEYGSLEECEEMCEETSVTYNCVWGSCYESMWGEGEYASLEECEEMCSEGSDSTMYACWEGSCVESAWGEYATLEECEEECEEVEETPWVCAAGSCYEDPTGALGTYATQEECEAACQEVETLWVCAAESCYEDITGLVGTYESEEACLEECTETSIEEEIAKVLVSPNPFSDYTILEFTNNPTHYNLYDISGRLVVTEKVTANRMQFSRGNLPSGVYYLELVGGDKIIREKLLIE